MKMRIVKVFLLIFILITVSIFLGLKSIEKSNIAACEKYLLTKKGLNDSDGNKESKMLDYIRKRKGLVHYEYIDSHASLLGIPASILYKVTFGNGSSEEMSFNFDTVGEISSVSDYKYDEIEKLYTVELENPASH